MEQKNRLVIAMLITVVIVVAMFTSFGRGLFSNDTPKITLPDVSGITSSDNSHASQSDEFLTVSVTPETVQNVIATLTRSGSYYREVSTESFWTGGSSVSTIQTWVDNGWSLILQTMPSGVIRHDLVGAEEAYFWYGSSSSYQTQPSDQLSADLAQRMPTYETVLALDTALITAAGYELREGIACIYVEVEDEELGYLNRYWVNIQSGLLISAETESDGILIYRMTAYPPIQTPCPADISFALPDGTVLHTM